MNERTIRSVLPNNIAVDKYGWQGFSGHTVYLLQLRVGDSAICL